MRTLNTSIPLAALALLLLLTGAREAQAQFSIGARGSYNMDAFTENGAEEGAYSLGAEARLGLAGLPVVINPGFDYYFNQIENANVTQFDANVLVPFGTDNAVFNPYAGLGLGVTRVAFDSDTPVLGNLVEETEMDYGLNVIGGATFGAGAIQPFAQARITFGEHLAFLNEDGEGGPGYALMAGLLFRLGQ